MAISPWQKGNIDLYKIQTIEYVISTQYSAHQNIDLSGKNRVENHIKCLQKGGVIGYLFTKSGLNL